MSADNGKYGDVHLCQLNKSFKLWLIWLFNHCVLFLVYNPGNNGGIHFFLFISVCAYLPTVMSHSTLRISMQTLFRTGASKLTLNL